MSNRKPKVTKPRGRAGQAQTQQLRASSSRMQTAPSHHPACTYSSRMCQQRAHVQQWAKAAASACSAAAQALHTGRSASVSRAGGSQHASRGDCKRKGNAREKKPPTLSMGSPVCINLLQKETVTSFFHTCAEFIHGCKAQLADKVSPVSAVLTHCFSGKGSGLQRNQENLLNCPEAPSHAYRKAMLPPSQLLPLDVRPQEVTFTSASRSKA